jgi:hypothetical protein
MRPKLLAMAQARWDWGQPILIQSVDQVPAITADCMLAWSAGADDSGLQSFVPGQL